MTTAAIGNPEALRDEELAVAAQGGAMDCFEALVARFQVPLLHFLQKKTANATDAEDLVQETFVRAYQNLERYDPQWRFSTWLYTIGYRLSVSLHRRQAHRGTPTAELEHVPDASQDPTAGPAAAEERSLLWDVARRQLSEQQFSILWMHYVDQMPLNEIAKVLGKSAVSVRAALFRARKKLTPHLEGFQDDKAEPAVVPTVTRVVSSALL